MGGYKIPEISIEVQSLSCVAPPLLLGHPRSRSVFVPFLASIAPVARVLLVQWLIF